MLSPRRGQFIADFGGSIGSHDEFAFQFVVGLCRLHEKAHGEKSILRGYQD
jgi:hypothetical protein